MNSEDIKSLEGCVSLVQYLREEAKNPSVPHKVEAVIFIRRIPAIGVSEQVTPSKSEVVVSQTLPMKSSPGEKKSSSSNPLGPAKAFWEIFMVSVMLFGMDFLSLDYGLPKMERDMIFIFWVFFFGISMCLTYVHKSLHPFAYVALYGIGTFFPGSFKSANLFHYSIDVFNHLLVDEAVWFCTKYFLFAIVFTLTSIKYEIAVESEIKKNALKRA